MKTVINTLLVVTIVALPAFSQSATAPEAKQAPSTAKARAKSEAKDYYPLKVGSTWHYRIDAGTGQKGTLRSVIAGVENSDGKSLSRLEVDVNGQRAPATEHLMSDEKGVSRVKMNGLELSPPLYLLKYPLKAGQKWETKTTVAGQQLDVSCRQGTEEDIEVPAGKYRAISSTIQTTQQTPKGAVSIVNTYWFANDVGVVKQKIEIGDKVILMELTKYEPAK
jgi:hypothetical protein